MVVRASDRQWVSVSPVTSQATPAHPRGVSRPQVTLRGVARARASGKPTSKGKGCGQSLGNIHFLSGREHRGGLLDPSQAKAPTVPRHSVPCPPPRDGAQGGDGAAVPVGGDEVLDERLHPLPLVVLQAVCRQPGDGGGPLGEGGAWGRPFGPFAVNPGSRWPRVTQIPVLEKHFAIFKAPFCEPPKPQLCQI